MYREFTGIFKSSIKNKRDKNSNGDIISRLVINTDDIIYVGEVFDDNNKLIRDRYKIYIKDVGDFIVAGTYKNMSDVLIGKKTIGYGTKGK